MIPVARNGIAMARGVLPSETMEASPPPQEAPPIPNPSNLQLGDGGFCRDFFTWYNDDHHHSGIGMLTPFDVHHELVDERIGQRQAALDAAFAAHPERFPRGRPTARRPAREVWINKPCPTVRRVSKSDVPLSHNRGHAPRSHSIEWCKKEHDDDDGAFLEEAIAANRDSNGRGALFACPSGCMWDRRCREPGWTA
jgi:hypothetical protein